MDNQTEGRPRHPGRARGEKRRRELIDAGIAVLSEQGWAGTTSRAVAERANAQLGLIHYHFGGFPQLKKAIAAQVIGEAFDAGLALLDSAQRWQDGVAAVIEQGGAVGDGPEGRLSAELIAGALQDQTVRNQLSAALADARQRVSARLQRDGVNEATAAGLAVALVAMLDGLLLHRLIDNDLPLGDAARAVEQF